MQPIESIERIEARLLDLSLRTTFRTHWKTLRHHSTLLVRVLAGGIWGEGEAYAIDPTVPLEEIESLSLTGLSPFDLETIESGILNRAARSAVDLALHDWIGKRLALPVHRFLGLPPITKTTCVSVGVDEPEKMIESARTWVEQGYSILKIKISTDTDLSIVGQIRRLGGDQLSIWVDANQAFEPEQAIRAADVLADLGVEIFEQPLPVGMLKEYSTLRPHLRIPVVLDEEILSADDVGRAARLGGIDGINVKLAKLGGLRESMHAIRVARAHGLSVLIGCFFESSLGIAAATHLQGLADRVDLDAPLFLEADPYVGLQYDGANVTPPKVGGIGVTRQEADWKD